MIDKRNRLTQSRDKVIIDDLLPKSVEQIVYKHSLCCIGSNEESNKNDQNHEMVEIIFYDIEGTTWLNTGPEKVMFSSSKEQTSLF